MQVWLDQIEWCQETTVRPNFIVILGDRYGWQPIPDSIEASEYEQLAETLSAEDIAFLTRVGDQQTGWYQLDNNSIPASYSRLNAAGERPTNDEWSTIESQIRHLFRRAADAAYGKRR